MTVLLCPLASPGYVYPALAVGRELLDTGAEVVVLTTETHRSAVETAGLTPLTVAECGGADTAFDVGSWHDPAAVVRQVAVVTRALARTSADRVVTSVLGHGALLAARAAALPVAVLGFACDVWTTHTADPVDAAWCHAETLRLFELARDATGLPPVPVTGSPLRGDVLLLRGQTALLPGPLPAGTMDVGPCWWEPADAVPDRVQEWLARDDKPTVYVHLGRVFGGGHHLLTHMCQLAGTGAVRLIVETGRSGQTVPDSPDVLGVRLPVMDPLVRACNAVATSATSAPVLAALRNHRPLLVHPAGSEQPSLAAATRHAGVARPAADVRDAADLSRLLADPGLRARLDTVAARLHDRPATSAADAVLTATTHELQGAAR